MMEELKEKPRTGASTIDVQQLIYERRQKEMQRKEGLTKSEIIEEVNDPAIYKKATKTK